MHAIRPLLPVPCSGASLLPLHACPMHGFAFRTTWRCP
uniref:Uncharacterized protein n=1 Tax=Arundo donax TaxID=35708 RepID=A0A0A9GZY0_ARUDO